MSNLTEVQVADTFKQTFINSGAVASSIHASIISGSETNINCAAGTDSGNGHYFNQAIINTPGYYVSEWDAVISGNPYKRKERIKAILGEVD